MMTILHLRHQSRGLGCFIVERPLTTVAPRRREIKMGRTFPRGVFTSLGVLAFTSLYFSCNEHGGFMVFQSTYKLYSTSQ